MQKAKTSSSTTVAARSDRPIRIRPATFEDFEAIAAVEKRNGLVTRTRDEWVHLWADNPAAQLTQGERNIAWVMETAASEVVGSFSSVPLAYRFQGRDLRASVGVGWAVDASHRAYSIWLLQHFLKQRDVDLFLSTTTSPEAEPVLRFLKWSPAPVGQWQKSAFWVTDHRAFLSAALHKMSITLPAAIRLPLSVVWSSFDRLRYARLSRNSSTTEIELCDGFDQRFDVFWDELERQNRHVLLAVRDRPTLTWHFRSALLHKNLWILAVLRNQRLLGYAIFDREDKPESGLKRVRLVDFVALENEQDSLRAALCWMLARCRQESLHALEVFGCWLDRPGPNQIRWPYRRGLSSCLYYYFVPDPTLRQALQTPSAWRPSSFDGDASLGTWATPGPAGTGS